MADPITGDESIDHWLEYYRSRFSPKDFAKICSQMVDLEGNRNQQLHKLREVMLGGFLACHGYAVEFERKHGHQRPEWTISQDGQLAAIVEVRNWHADIGIEDDIRGAMSTPAKGTAPERFQGKSIGGMKVVVSGQPFVFPDLPARGSPHFDLILLRLYQELEGKFGKYKKLANDLNVPYIVGLAVQFVAGGMITQQDVIDTLFGADSKLFENHRHVSGVYCYSDGNGYYMRYISNPHAARPLQNMPQGSPRP
jgi:hypothetical protein